MYLGKMTTLEAKEAFKNDPVVVIPVGSTEQHGDQCALGTDYIVPTHLAKYISDVDNVIIAPTIPYGVCPYHLSFAGSINIGYEGLYLVLKGIVDSLMKQGVRKFLILNGHGGNTPSIDRASLDVYNNGGISTSIDWWSLIGELDEKFKGGHGDKVETSAMMAIDRNLVKLEYSKPINAKVPMDDVKANTIQTIKFKGGTVKFSRDTKEIAPSGWFGPFDPKDSTVEYGKEALDLARKFIKDFIEEYRKLEI